jgi:hypothetical protein
MYKVLIIANGISRQIYVTAQSTWHAVEVAMYGKNWVELQPNRGMYKATRV